MGENSRFEPVFAKLHAILGQGAQQPAKVGIDTGVCSEAGMDELDEIDYLRRIVLDVTEPEPMLFTTT